MKTIADALLALQEGKPEECEKILADLVHTIKIGIANEGKEKEDPDFARVEGTAAYLEKNGIHCTVIGHNSVKSMICGKSNPIMLAEAIYILMETHPEIKIALSEIAKARILQQLMTELDKIGGERPVGSLFEIFEKEFPRSECFDKKKETEH